MLGNITVFILKGLTESGKERGIGQNVAPKKFLLICGRKESSSRRHTKLRLKE
jgi:hypothetical protein